MGGAEAGGTWLQKLEFGVEGLTFLVIRPFRDGLFVGDDVCRGN